MLQRGINYSKIKGSCKWIIGLWILYIENTCSELWSKFKGDDISGTVNHLVYVIAHEYGPHFTTGIFCVYHPQHYNPYTPTFHLPIFYT